MYYIIVTHSVYADSTLPDGAKLLYGLILSLSQKDGFCYADNEYLATTLNKDTRTIQLYLSKLKDKRYILIDIIQNRFRRIITQDTRVKLAPAPKNPLEAKKRVDKQIPPEPEWISQWFDDLKDWQKQQS